MTVAWIIAGLVCYSAGATLTAGFFGKRAPESGFGGKDYTGTTFAAIFWPFMALFIVPPTLYLERIQRKLEELEARLEEERRLIRIADQELEQEDQEASRRLRGIK